MPDQVRHDGVRLFSCQVNIMNYFHINADNMRLAYMFGFYTIHSKISTVRCEIFDV